MTNSDDGEADEISLTEINFQRQESEKRTRDGQSGPVLYQIKYDDDKSTIVCGKSTEVGRIADSNRMDLEAIQTDQYTHYAIFRLKDRSTITILQDESGRLYKLLSLGRDIAKIAHQVTITELPRE